MAGVIFYGAGQYARWILGAEPLIAEFPPPPDMDKVLCFADADVSKQGKTYMGLPVLPVGEAVEKYPDAGFYLTARRDLALRWEMGNALAAKGVDKGRIINRVRRSCPYLESFVVCGYHEGAFGGKAGFDCGRHSFKSCCSDYGKNEAEFIPIGENLEEAFQRFLDLRLNLLGRVDDGLSSKCEGCREITLTEQPLPERFSYLIYNELGICNCRCVYCNYEERLGRDVRRDVDFIRLYELLRRQGFDNENGVIELCSGEITVHPQKKEIYEAVRSNRVMFLTNGLVWDEEIQRKMRDGSGILNLSMDSGTRDTFFQVKGVDAYDRVVANLRRYGEGRKGELNLKYILLPGVNDNERNIDGFVRLCAELNVSQAHISHDLSQTYEAYDNRRTIHALEYMLERLKSVHIPVEIYSKNILERLPEREGGEQGDHAG